MDGMSVVSLSLGVKLVGLFACAGFVDGSLACLLVPLPLCTSFVVCDDATSGGLVSF